VSKASTRSWASSSASSRPHDDDEVVAADVTDERVGPP
jgi:hypothetical protein